MDRNQSLIIFNISEDADPEDIKDEFHSQAFHLYSPLFTNDPVPALLRSKIKKLNHLREGLEALTGTEKITGNFRTGFSESTDPVLRLKEYRDSVLKLRRDLSHTGSISESVMILEEMMAVRLNWDKFWINFTEEISSFEQNFPDLIHTVKVSENLEIQNLINLLRELTAENEKISLKDVRSDQMSFLLKERVRSRKILEQEKSYG